MTSVGSSLATIGAARDERPAPAPAEHAPDGFSRALADRMSAERAADDRAADAADAADARMEEAEETARRAAQQADAHASDLAADVAKLVAGLGEPPAEEPAAAPSAGVARRDTAALAPEFKSRLDRVISRMRAAGHTVEIVETHRSQDRQNALFAQGRTADGPVVTWTRSSQHTKGLAADLLVDGQWAGGEGYETLARIAQEEGLSTLGAKDPGHVQLGGSTRFAPPALLGAQAAGTPNANAEALVARVAQVARVAESAPVAAPANVARVAQVAEVAQPGVGGVGARARRGQAEREGAGAQGGSSHDTMAWTQMAERAALGVSGSVGEAPATLGTDAIARLDRIDALRATADAQPMSFMTLRVDNAAGGTDRIRVDLRGTAVGATLQSGIL